jgi:hypothetical protein
MKHLKLFLVVLLVAGITFACSSPKKDITKKWKMSTFDAPGLDDGTKKAITEKAFFEFMPDGKYIIMGLSESNDEGTWEIDKDAKTLTTKSTTSGKTETLQVKELTKDKLVLTDGTNTMTLIPK